MPAIIPAIVGGLGLTGAAATIVSGILSIGLSFGLSLVSSLLMPKPKSPRPEDVQGIIRQSVSPRFRHYGRVRVGGSIIFIETKDGSLYQLIAHGQGPIDGYEQTYLDNRPVTLASGDEGGVTTDPYKPEDQIIWSRTGDPSVTGFSKLETDFPSIWNSTYRVRGIAASLLFTVTVDPEDTNETYPNRIPFLSRVIRGARCYNPATGSTSWTRNAALIMRDYLTHADGMNLPASLIDDDLIETATADSAANVTIKAGGTIDRYAIGLSYSFEEEPINVVTRILTATDGRLFITSAGKIGFEVGKWAEPDFTLTDDHIIEWDLTDGGGPFVESNEVIIRYTHTDVGYKEATSDPWRDDASISAYGRLSRTIEAFEIQHHNHARRIAKINQLRSAPRWRGTILCNLHALNVWDKRTVHLTIADLEIDDDFEIVGPPAIDAGNMTIVLEVQSASSAMYNFNASTEEGEGPTVPEVLEEEEIPQPTGVVTQAIERKLGDVEIDDTVYDPGSGENGIDSYYRDVKVYIAKISWAAPSRKGLQAVAEFSLDGVNWVGMSVPSKEVFAETPALPRPSTVRMRVRFRTKGGTVSNWTTGSNVSIPS